MEALGEGAKYVVLSHINIVGPPEEIAACFNATPGARWPELQTGGAEVSLRKTLCKNCKRRVDKWRIRKGVGRPKGGARVVKDACEGCFARKWLKQ